MIGLTEQIACIEREIKFRRFVYPKRVAEGKMSEKKMHYELLAMQAIHDTLRSVRDYGVKETVALKQKELGL